MPIPSIPPGAPGIRYAFDVDGNVAGIAGPAGGSIANPVSTYSLNFFSENLPNLRKMKAGVLSGGGRGILGIVGDSTFVGQGSGGANAANSQVNGPAAQLARYLTRVGIPAVNSSFFGDGGANRYGQTVNVQDPRITLGTGWSDTYGFVGTSPGGAFFFYNGGAAATLSFKPAEAMDHVTVYYYTSTNNGEFTVNVNGGTSLGTTSTNASSNISSVTYAFTRVSGGTNTINVVPVASSGNIAIIGMDCWDSTVPAISILNFANRGAVVGDYVAPAFAVNFPQNLNLFGAQAWLIQLTVNDSNTPSTPLGTYSADMSELITSLQNSGAADVILSSGVPSDTTQGMDGTLGEYVAVLTSLATAGSLPAAYFGARFGIYPQSAYYYYDALHLLATGYADEAQFLGALIAAV